MGNCCLREQDHTTDLREGRSVPKEDSKGNLGYT